ncbi:MAG: FAD-dependent oxidoreductase, partial [Clostridia bacterium]|nr:FAD-dependent oxidoreductase [Clostridia bacterium]
MRERYAAQIVRTLTDKPVMDVVDPVLLADPADFDAITAPRPVRGRYLLAYYTVNPAAWMLQRVARMKIQPGDPVVVPFSYSTDPADVQIEQVPCWLTYTTEETHEIIRQNLDRSPIYAGIIEGTGPRYCPS